MPSLLLIGRDPRSFASYLVITSWSSILRARWLTKLDIHHRRIPEILRSWRLEEPALKAELGIIENLKQELGLYHILLRVDLPSLSSAHRIPFTLAIDGPILAHNGPQEATYVTESDGFRPLDVPRFYGTMTSGPKHLVGITYAGDDPMEIQRQFEREVGFDESYYYPGGPLRGWEDDLGS